MWLIEYVVQARLESTKKNTCEKYNYRDEYLESNMFSDEPGPVESVRL